MGVDPDGGSGTPHPRRRPGVVGTYVLVVWIFSDACRRSRAGDLLEASLPRACILLGRGAETLDLKRPSSARWALRIHDVAPSAGRVPTIVILRHVLAVQTGRVLNLSLQSAAPSSLPLDLEEAFLTSTDQCCRRFPRGSTRDSCLDRNSCPIAPTHLSVWVLLHSLLIAGLDRADVQDDDIEALAVADCGSYRFRTSSESVDGYFGNLRERFVGVGQ
jgi:hypothetical protein